MDNLISNFPLYYLLLYFSTTTLVYLYPFFRISFFDQLLIATSTFLGIDISSIADNPLSVYMSKKHKTKEVGVMAETIQPVN